MAHKLQSARAVLGGESLGVVRSGTSRHAMETHGLLAGRESSSTSTHWTTPSSPSSRIARIRSRATSRPRYSGPSAAVLLGVGEPRWELELFMWPLLELEVVGSSREVGRE